jgi:hypothetical protein
MKRVNLSFQIGSKIKAIPLLQSLRFLGSIWWLFGSMLFRLGAALLQSLRFQRHKKMCMFATLENLQRPINSPSLGITP